MKLFAIVGFILVVVSGVAVAAAAAAVDDPEQAAVEQKQTKGRLANWLGFGSSAESKPKLQRSNSVGSNFQYGESTPNGLGTGNDNKVSELLHFLHRKSSDAIYSKAADSSEVDAKGADAKEAAKDADDSREHEHEEPDYSNMSDEQILLSFCTNESFAYICKLTVQAALRRSPQESASIAQAIRARPAHVNANSLLFHKLFETGIMKFEQKGLDKKLNMAVDLLAKRNPYFYAATKVVDLGRQLSRRGSFSKSASRARR